MSPTRQITVEYPTVAFVSDVSNGSTCPEVITRTYSVTDACLNQILVTQLITIDDDTAPTASNLAPVTVQCIGDVPAANILDVTDEADNCGVPTVAFVSDVSNGSTCPEVITRTYSVTDACLNQILVTQLITIDDDTAPTASNLAPVTVQCIGDVPAANILDVTDEADNCGVPTVAFVSDVSNGSTCPEVITRTYSVTDACLNQILVTQLITIDDDTAPTASNLAPVTVQCIGDVPAANILDVTDEADNCGVPTVAFVSDVSNGSTCPEVITRTYSVTDACLNQILVTQLITIDDDTAPTASNLAPVTVQCIGDVPAANILDVTDEADNCGVPTVAFVSDVSNGSTCPEVITRTYSVTDACLNQILVTQLITIDDDTAPTASNLAPVTVQCIGDVPAANILDVTDEADNCGVPTVAFVSDVSNGSTCPEVITRTYSVTDACLNQILVTQLITIDDDTAPTASNLAPVTVQCIGDVPAANILDVTDEADNCGVPTVAFVSDVSNGSTCPEVITRTYSVTDACLNQILVTQLITIDDDTAPTASNLAPVTVQCIGDVPAANILDVTDEADNCGVPTVAFVSDVSNGSTCPEVITRTYSVTDACLNQILVTQLITIDDDTAPTASNLAPVTVQCIGDVPAANILDVTDEADNCGVPTVAFVSDVSNGSTCPEVITRTYSVTDACLNQILVTQLITIDDDTAPTASNLAPVTVQCIGDVPAANILDVTDEADNCGVPTVAFVSDVSNGSTCPEVITRTYSVTDACLNQILVTQLITIDDDTAPTASNLAPVTVQCIGDVPAANILDVTDEADNCGVPTVAFVSDVSNGSTCPEVITRTYSVTDACLNQILVTQLITIDDDTAPTASNLAPVTVQCIGDVPAANILDVTDEADNCGVPTVAFVSDVSNGSTCPEVITRTYSVTDACLNQILVTQLITIDDDTAPTASNLAPVTVQCIGDVPAANILDVTDEADNCGVPTVAFVSDVSNGSTCPEVITRTYSVTDACLNQILVTQLITIDDDTAPTASNLAPVTVQCIGDVPAANILDVTDEADNCGVPTVAFVSDVSNGSTCPEVITRTYSVTDACLNQILVTQLITIDDDTAPTASNLAPVTVQCIGDVPAANILDVTDEADNCGVPTVAFVSDVSNGSTCPEVITRTYSVTDACLNQILVTQLITIDDDTAPTASNLAPVTVQCIGDVPAANILDVTDEADNCGVPTVAFVSDVSNGSTCPEVITRTYSVTDACLNQILVTQLITIDDDTAPTASNLAPVTVQCIGDVPAANILDVTDEADNCGVPTVAFVSDVSNGSTCPEVITRTYSVTDACLNQILVTQLITIDDDTAPTASNLAPVTVQCIGDVPAANILDVTDEADNCGVPTVAFVSDVSNGSTCPEVITRTYSVTDACLNQILVTQLITIDDDTAPTASNLAPVTVQCIGDVPAANILDVTDEADNCGVPTVAFVSDVSNGSTCPEVITRTYSVTDACLNQILVTQLITIDDDTAPTASNLAPVTVQCIGDVPAANILDVTDEADNCGVPTVAFVSDVSNGSTCPEVITRTYSVTDACLNQILVTQLITIDDDTAPTASNLAPVTVQCIGDVPAANILDVTDEADNCGVPTVAFVSDVSNGSTCPEVITRTYSVTDACLNQILVTQLITIDDDTAPTASNLAPVTVQCIGDVPAANILDVTDEADNCGVPTVAFVSDVSNGSTCPEVITRTYSVTDACLNQILVTQLITIDDDTAPTASNLAPVTVQCIGDVPAANILDVTDEADNCGVPTVAFVSDVSNGSTCPEVITRTYSVTDACLNQILVTQLITIDDDILPIITGCPSDITVSNDVGDCSAIVNWVIPVATDNCGIFSFVSSHSPGDTFPIGTTTVTYTATDNCGNVTTCIFDITVNDSEIPTITCPVDITVNNNAGLCGAIVNFVAPVGSDNCPGAITTQTTGLVSGALYPVGTTVNTYQVVDAYGNINTCSFNITVVDAEDPQIVCPGNLSVTGVCSTVVTYITPTGTDNCPGAITTQTAGLPSGATFPVGVTTNTFMVTDAAGRIASCTFTIEVIDDIDPVIICPGDIIVSNDPGICSAVVNYVAPVGTDNCPGPITTQIAGLPSGSTFPAGTTVNTFLVTDVSGNTAQCSFNVIVNDTELPVIACPANLAVNNDAGVCGAIVNYAAIVGSDNCPGSVTVQSLGLPSGAFFPIGTTTNVFTVIDASGNSSNCNFTVTVSDTEAPVITGCPVDQGPLAMDAGVCGATVTWVDPTANDNCDGVVAVLRTDITGLNSGDLFPAGVTTISYNATDTEGNVSLCSFDVTVSADSEAPVISGCPVDQGPLVMDAGLCGATVTWVDPTANDNCDGVIAAVRTDITGLNSGDLFPAGVTTISYSATDGLGNISTCSFNVTVTDSEAPVISGCPVDQGPLAMDAGLCGATVTWVDPTANDNCDGVVAVLRTDITGLNSGDLFPAGVTTISYSATDGLGNISTCSFNVTVTDSEAPVISGCPVDQGPLAMDAGLCGATVTWADPTANDNCDGVIAVLRTDITGLNSGDLFPAGVTTISYNATDTEGNVSLCSFDVTVSADSEAPVISGCPVDQGPLVMDAGLCGATVTWADPTANDNCDGVIAAVRTDITGLNSGDLFPAGVTTISYSATDGLGNISTCSFNVTVTDSEAPVISGCPVDQGPLAMDAGLCGATVTWVDPTANDNCDGVVAVLRTDITGLNSGDLFPAGVTTISYNATDTEGNVSTMQLYCNCEC